LTQESEENGEGGNVSLEQDQIREILSGLVLNRENYQQIYSALSVYVAELNHSMVTVTGVSSNIDWFNNVEESKKQSSGVIIANNGKELLVLVDYTPLQTAESLTLTSSFLDATKSKGSLHQIPVSLKSHDPATGLAILSVDLADVPAEVKETGGLEIATLGSSNSKNIIGTPVIALGSPMGSSGSVGYGIITATGSQNYQADANYKLLQTDIYGSQKAGGVLFNLQGQVIGVITNESVSSDMKNMVTAYGISELKKSIEKMSNGERIAYLGISGIDVSDEAYEELGVPYGAFVRDVEMNSPAMNAGIQQGDVLTSFGERSIRNYNDYITALMQAKGGEAVDLTVMRAAQGEYREMKVIVTPDWRQ
ncbi:MAG: S1C family serine protease, partial [Acetatifactor sp.]|nr:S1C family serine protease [Acetatifactor sp.]